MVNLDLVANISSSSNILFKKQNVRGDEGIKGCWAKGALKMHHTPYTDHRGSPNEQTRDKTINEYLKEMGFPMMAHYAP